MVGIRRALVIGQVAEDAGVGRDVVTAIFLVVTIRALARWHCVQSGQGEVRVVVIE